MSPENREQTPADAHGRPLTELLAELRTDRDVGLATEAVSTVRARAGWNELTAAPAVPVWRKLLAEFNDVVIWILLVAALISGITGEWTDTAAIIAIVLMNALLGYYQEDRAERALAALQELSAPTAKVVRGGQRISVPARDVVPGDIVELEAGDNVPADLRLFDAFSLQVQEATLTGESVPTAKDATVDLPRETPLSERRNMAYMSTLIANGTARGIVIATGMQTEIGRIAKLLDYCQRESTPLQRQLATLGRTLAAICLLLVGVVFALSLIRGDSWLNALLTAVSLAVAAVPEGLPAVVTIALALGLQRMVRRNALIRKLPSVETLGCVTVICSDKTGTLTRNQMTVREMFVDDKHIHVSGGGYVPQGEFHQVPPSVPSGNPVRATDNATLQLALQIGFHCNNARLELDDGRDHWNVIGDPTEGALIVVAMKAGIHDHPSRPQILSVLPFDSVRKMMSVLVKNEHGLCVQFTKGAPEVLLSRCAWEQRAEAAVPLTAERRDALRAICEEMGSRALRVLACGFREVSAGTREVVEEKLTFVGLFGMIDPPREEVKAAVARCREAGIRTVMITGDHATTAAAIGRELGIATAADTIISGAELDQIDDQALVKRVERLAVYARVAPEHKLRVVRALQAQGHVVAMTGDGVNDAPAVKAADIGIAMGKTGTDVTREAAAMVLMDDNFTSIANAVEEGRAIYDNIRKFLYFLLACNVSEMLLMLIAGVLGWPTPLLPIHLLWINLVTDGLPALALAMEPPEPDLMRRQPRQAQEPILPWKMGWVLVGQGLLLAFVALVAFGFVRFQGQDLDHARSLTFCVVVFSQLFSALAARSRQWTFWQLRPGTNPYLFAAVSISTLLQLSIMTLPFARPVFEAKGHSLWEWVLLGMLALIPVTLLELFKLASQPRRAVRPET